MTINIPQIRIKQGMGHKLTKEEEEYITVEDRKAALTLTESAITRDALEDLPVVLEMTGLRDWLKDHRVGVNKEDDR